MPVRDAKSTAGRKFALHEPDLIAAVAWPELDRGPPESEVDRGALAGWNERGSTHRAFPPGGTCRRNFQRKLIDQLRAKWPLREGLSSDEAADTYSAIASPETYLLLTTHHGWSPDQFETWLGDSLQRLLLPPTT